MGPLKCSASCCKRPMEAGAAARSECKASPALNKGRPLALSACCAAHTLSAVVAKRRWSGRSRGWPKPARSYSTGNTVRPRPASAAASARAQAQAQGVGIGRAVGIVLQVVEVADLRVAAPQQLHIQLGRNGLQLIGADAQGHAVHAVAPGPEVVRGPVSAGLAPLGQAGKRPLKGVAVGIDQPGQHRPRQQLGAFGHLGHTAAHLAPAAALVDAQQHLLLPAPRQPGLGGPEQPLHAGRQSSTACSRLRSTGVRRSSRWGSSTQGASSAM